MILGTVQIFKKWNNNYRWNAAVHNDSDRTLFYKNEFHSSNLNPITNIQDSIDGRYEVPINFLSKEEVAAGKAYNVAKKGIGIQVGVFSNFENYAIWQPNGGPFVFFKSNIS